MKPGVLLFRNSLLALILFVGLFDILESKVTCDLRHLRYLYMMSCGIKKRSAFGPGFNETFFTLMPLDYFAAAKYYKENIAYNPELAEDRELYEIFKDYEEYFEESQEFDPELDIETLFRIRDRDLAKLESSRKSRNTFEPETPSLLLRILTKNRRKSNQENWLGEHEIPGFPPEWDIDELREPGEVKFNGRRNLDELIEQCCKTVPEVVCSAATIKNACKK